MRRLTLVGLLILMPSLAWATDLQVTDSQGTTVLVKDAVVDYGSLLAADSDKDGIRVQQGDALVRLKWAEVQALSITRGGHVGEAGACRARRRDGERHACGRHAVSQGRDDADGQGAARRLHHSAGENP